MNSRARTLLAVIAILSLGLGAFWLRTRSRTSKSLVPAQAELESGLEGDSTELVTPDHEELQQAIQPRAKNEPRGQIAPEGIGVLLPSTNKPLRTTGTVRGEIRSELGDPVPDCEVLLIRSDGRRQNAVADWQGQFVFIEVPVGSQRLYVENPNVPEFLRNTMTHECAKSDRPWRGAQCLQLEADGGEPDPVVIVLRSAAQVKGRIVDQRGRPVSDATVYHEYRNIEDWRESTYQQTGSDGRFHLYLYPGQVELRTSLSQFSDWTDLGVPPEFKLDLGPAEERDIGDIMLGGGGASLVGSVMDANGNPAAMIKVVMTRKGGVGSMSTESNDDGSFAFLGVYPGEYQFAVAPDGAILGNPRRFLHEPGPVSEVIVSGEVGPIDLGEFSLRFDGSFHLYAELVFADGRLPAWEDLSARALLPSGIELKDEDLEFQSRTRFEWHVREPDLIPEVVIEVSELDPVSKEPLWTQTVDCRPRRHQRQRVRIAVE